MLVGCYSGFGYSLPFSPIKLYMSKIDKRKVLEELEDVIFPSDEDNGVEHIDMSYKVFIKKIRQLAA
jgi:hypothetical protein